MGITSVGVEGTGGISLLSPIEASSRWPTLPFFPILPVPLPPFRKADTSSSVPEVELRVGRGLPTSEVGSVQDPWVGRGADFRAIHV